MSEQKSQGFPPKRPKRTVILEQQTELVEDEAEGTFEVEVWVVAATRNTLDWKIGSVLTETEVKELINDKVEVEIA